MKAIYYRLIVNIGAVPNNNSEVTLWLLGLYLSQKKNRHGLGWFLKICGVHLLGLRCGWKPPVLWLVSQSKRYCAHQNCSWINIFLLSESYTGRKPPLCEGWARGVILSLPSHYYKYNRCASWGWPLAWGCCTLGEQWRKISPRHFLGVFLPLCPIPSGWNVVGAPGELTVCCYRALEQGNAPHDCRWLIKSNIPRCLWMGNTTPCWKKSKYNPS